MATKEHKRQIRETIEGLEVRVHSGPPIRGMELQMVRDFLGQHDFSPASDYYSRLEQIQERLQVRMRAPAPAAGKANYGGESAGRYLQVLSVYDHVIISTCYEGDFNTRHGRIKISHRFNQQGRADFVELKFLRSLEPWLTGEIRKLLLVRDYQSLRKDWLEAEAFTLPVLPQELVFLFPDVFRAPRAELLAWLINIGHGLTTDLVGDLASRRVPPLNGHRQHPRPAHWLAPASNQGSRPESSPANGSSPFTQQADLSQLKTDEVAWPILQRASSLSSVVEVTDPRHVTVRYSARWGSTQPA